VRFLGVSSPETDCFVFPRHARITLQNLRHCAPGWRQKLHYVWFALRTIALSISWRPDWIYASDALCSPVALLLTFIPGVRTIYHEHDTPGTADDSLFMRMVYASRKSLTRRAEICILPNEQRARRFSAELPNVRTICVWNCPSTDEVLSESAPKEQDSFWLLYHGTIVPARLPKSILAALKLLPETVKLRVIGYETIGHRGYVSDLQNEAQRLGIRQRIDFVGSVPSRKDLLGWCLHSHVGLAFMPPANGDINMTNMTGASNKAFDYMACEMPLLVSDLPDWRSVFVENGFGLSCDMTCPESIAKAIGWFLDHPLEMQAMGQRARVKIRQEWNYEKQFAPVLEFMTGDGSAPF
jgi:glycosyltransferase involved in cell wall biosynthesis